MISKVCSATMIQDDAHQNQMSLHMVHFAFVVRRDIQRNKKIRPVAWITTQIANKANAGMRLMAIAKDPVRECDRSRSLHQIQLPW